MRIGDKFVSNAYYFIGVLLLFFLAAAFQAAATPPASPYIAGETLDPTCSPGDPNCYVTPIAIGTFVGNGTSGSIPFIDASGEFAEDNSGLFWDEVGRRLGLGTNNPGYELEAVSESQNVEIVATGYNNRKPVFGGRSSGGTEATPSSTASGDILTEFAGQGYGATGFAPSSTASMRYIAEQNFTDTAYGTQIRWFTTNNNATSLQQRMVLTAAGNLGIGDSTPLSLLTIGNSDAFQVNSTGAIVAATGITSSGTVTLTGLPTGVILSTGGTLSSATSLPVSQGGTGLTTLGASNQILGINNAGTASEYKTLTTGTSGTDFAISNTAGVVTFNLPSASATNRGLLTSTDWSTFNNKADDFLDLTDTPSTYTAQANKILAVNSAENAVNFVSEIAESGSNLRIGVGSVTGNIANTIIGAGSKAGAANSFSTYIGYNINNAGSAFGNNVVIGGNSTVVNADNMVAISPTLNHARIGGMVVIGDSITLPTSGAYNGAAGNSPVYIGYGINNSETTTATKGNIFIGRNISTSGFTSNATTKAIVIAQDPILENGMQNSVVIGADTSVLDAESNVTVIGNGAMAYLDPTYGNGGGDGVAIGRNTKTGSWRATALGSYAQALAVSSTAIGYGAYTNVPHGIAIGRGSYVDENGSVVIQPDISTGATDIATVYVGAIGSYWTNPAMPGTETVDISTTLNAGTVVSRITGASGRDTRAVPLLTNIRGGHLRLLGGMSTGTAEGGDIQFAVTPAGGVSNNTLNNEFVAGSFKADKKFYLFDNPNNDDALTQVLVRDAATGEIKYRSASSLMSADPLAVGDGGTGTTTAFTTGSLVFSGAGGVYTEDNSNLFFDNTNNQLGIGVNTGLGASLHVRGSGATAATSSFLVQNSTPVSLFEVVNDGNIYIRNNGTSVWRFGSGQMAYTDGFSINSFSLIADQVTIPFGKFKYTGTSTATGSDFTTANQIDFETTFSPTSGTGQYTPIYMQPTINQTGGANGITAGIVINPTLTSAADWRSVYLTNTAGYGIYQSVAAVDNYYAGQISIGTDPTPDFNLEVEDNSIDGNIFSLKDSDGQCDHDPEAGAEVVTCSSDERLKANITLSEEVLNDLMKYTIRDYDVIASGDRMTGVIAQEVRQVFPDDVVETSSGFLSVKQPSLWKIVKAIQELKQGIDNIDAGLESRVKNYIESSSTFFEKIFVKKVETQELCIEDVCITKDQLLYILENTDTNYLLNTNDNNNDNAFDNGDTTNEPSDNDEVSLTEDETSGTETQSQSDEELFFDENSNENPEDIFVDEGEEIINEDQTETIQ